MGPLVEGGGGGEAEGKEAKQNRSSGALLCRREGHERRQAFKGRVGAGRARWRSVASVTGWPSCSLATDDGSWGCCPAGLLVLRRKLAYSPTDANAHEREGGSISATCAAGQGGPGSWIAPVGVSGTTDGAEAAAAANKGDLPVVERQWAAELTPQMQSNVCLGLERDERRQAFSGEEGHAAGGICMPGNKPLDAVPPPARGPGSWSG